MAFDNKTNKLRRKEAVGMEALIQDYIREMKLASGVNRQRVTEAWNSVTGSSAYTMDVSLVKGVLYVSLNSSLVRNQLYFQREIIMQQINEYVEKDSLFVKENKEGPVIKNIVLR